MRGLGARPRRSARSASSAGRGPRTRAPARADEIVGWLARQPGVAERLLGRLRPLLVAAAEVRDRRRALPDVHEPGVVPGLLEQRQRRPRERLELVDRRLRVEHASVAADDDAGERLAGLVAGARAPLGWRRRRSPRLSRGSAPAALGRSSSRWTSSRIGRVSSSARSSRSRGCALVAAPQRAPAGGGEPLACPLGQLRIGLAELRLVAGRLLEVVAEELVQLD